MNKMLFEFEPQDELFTPSVIHDGVNDINPILTSSPISLLDVNDIDFSSTSSKKNEYELNTKDHPHDNNENIHQEDLYSSFNFPVLSEFSRTDLGLDGFQLEKYIDEVSASSPSMDIHNTSISEDSTFYPIDDSNSSTFLWVGNECTVESKNPGDMTVPPSPPLSSVGDSPTTSKKKRSLSTIDRKLRKKDQNKTAAEKYRLKKRTERDFLISRHTELKNQNQELKFEMENLTFQLEQFKNLFVDILQIPIPSHVSK